MTFFTGFFAGVLVIIGAMYLRQLVTRRYGPPTEKQREAKRLGQEEEDKLAGILGQLTSVLTQLEEATSLNAVQIRAVEERLNRLIAAGVANEHQPAESVIAQEKADS